MAKATKKVKFIKHPLFEEQKPLPTSYFIDGREVIQFKKEMVVDGTNGEFKKVYVYETDNPEHIEVIENMEKKLSEKVTRFRRDRLRSRMNKISQRGLKHPITEAQISRVNVKIRYFRGEEPQQKEAPTPQRAVS